MPDGDAASRVSVITLLNRHRWSMFCILAVAYFFVYFHRLSVSVVGSDIVEELGGSIGILSSVYFWTYAIMQIPCGVLTDRFGPRATCTVFLLIGTAGSLITCFGNSFEMMVLGKMLIATGMAVIYVPLLKLISIWFPKKDFAVLSGVVIAVGNIGALAAAGPLSMLADAVGWRDVFLILGSITLIIAAAVFVIVRDDPEEMGLPRVCDAKDQTVSNVPVSKGLPAVFSGGRRFWPFALSYFLIYGTIMTFQGTWAIKYFDTFYGFAVTSAWMITCLGIGKILSTLMIGAFVTRGLIRSKKNAMIFGAVCFTAVWAVILVFAGELNNYWFWLVICSLFGFFGGFMTQTFSCVREWYPTAIAGTSVSATNLFLFLGASVCTTISGWIIGTEYTLSNFSMLWALMLAFSAAAVLLLIISKEKHDDDELIGLDAL